MQGVDQAAFEINVGGQNVTERFNPLLESLTVVDKAGTTSDTAHITLDDNGGHLYMPSKGDPITILLGWRSSGIGLVFDGTVDEIRATGSRGGGRTMTIGAKGFDTKSKAKEPLEFHKDDATLQEFLSDAAKKAGLDGVKVSSSLASIKREYWLAGTESFIHLGQRLAEEVGGTFKVVGRIGILTGMGEGLSVSGVNLGSVSAIWGDNLLNYDISPTLARPRFREARTRHYDRKAAKWKEEKLSIEIPGLGAEAQHTHRMTRADQDEAKHSARSNKKKSEREAGSGTVLIIGNITPQPEGSCLVANCRPGIDGSYKIESVEHCLTRSNGFTTKLGLKEPGAGAGADSRD